MKYTVKTMSGCVIVDINRLAPACENSPFRLSPKAALSVEAVLSAI